MSITVRIKDDDGEVQSYSVNNGVKLVNSDGTGFETFIQPSGAKYIQDTTAQDVTEYATAQVSDSNLVAGNIKNGVSILGVTGTYEGGGSNAALIGVLDGTITQLTAQDLDGLTEIRPYALQYHQNLISVELPFGVEKIGYIAFSGCGALTTINFPDTLEIIEDNAFEAAALSNVSWGNGIKEIGNYAFYSTFIQSVSLPSVETIFDSAFYACQSLTHVYIGASCTEIGYQAFCYCPSLIDVTIESTTPPVVNVEGIPYSLPFYLCNNLSAIYVPAASVNTYQTTPGWSTYASIIQAIT